MRLLMSGLFVLLSAQALAAECVQATLKDLNGLSIATERPLIGFLMPDGVPLVDYGIPAGSKVESGLSVPCSPEVIASVSRILNESCSTDAKRAATAKTNNVAADIVNKRCKDIYMGLNKK
jgi:hypothetical protein